MTFCHPVLLASFKRSKCASDNMNTFICVCVCLLQVQLSLYTYLSAEFIGTATIYSTIRRVGTVLQIMHMLKYYYWAANPAEGSCITPKGLGESKLFEFVLAEVSP